MRYTITFLLALWVVAPGAWSAPIDQNLPSLNLPAPEDAAYRQYLGIGDAPSFTVADINARVVIVEVFSMYCPHCQKEASVINDLYRQISAHPQWADQIKMLGIGAGNSAFEVNYFRETYHIAFPLIPDPHYDIHQAIGDVRTPYFVVFDLSRSGSPHIVYSEPGGIGSPDSFLKTVLSRTPLSR